MLSTNSSVRCLLTGTAVFASLCVISLTSAVAECIPAAEVSPPEGSRVTCSGATPEGYPGASLNGLTLINTQAASTGRISLNNDATILNSGEISSDGLNVIVAGQNLNVTNFAGGTITAPTGGGGYAIRAASATITNYGTISSSQIFSNTISVSPGDLVLNNFGMIAKTSGLGPGVQMLGGMVLNSGIIRTDLGSAIDIAPATPQGASGTIPVIVNSGTVSGSQDSGAALIARRTVSVINSGLLENTRPSFDARFPSASVIFTAPNNSLSILPGARFTGPVDFRNQPGNRITFGPGNWLLNIVNYNSAQSVVAALAGSPVVVTPNQIIVLDRSNYLVSDASVVDFTRAAGESTFSATEAVGTQGMSPPSGRVWSTAFGGATSANGESRRSYAGGIAGFDRVAGPDVQWGIFGGGAELRTRGRAGGGNATNEVAFIGAHLRQSWRQSWLDARLSGGYLNSEAIFNSSLPAARQDYGGWFIEAGLSYSGRLTLVNGWSVIPRVGLRYIAGGFDGYSYVDPVVSAVSVPGRTFGAVEERADLAFAYSTRYAAGEVLDAKIRVGTFAVQATAGSTFRIDVAGNSLALAPTGSIRNTGAAVVDFGLSWKNASGLALFGEFGTVAPSTRDYLIHGRVGVKTAL